jgi:CDP-ribitol ribitolphosphotransferase
MLSKKLQERYPEKRVIVLTKKFKFSIGYFFHMFHQFFCIIKSDVVILDSYCLMISLLPKRKKPIVIQMWHSIGLMKKVGYSILDTIEGRSSKMAKLLKMHKNYDYIFASSEKAKPAIAELFGYNQDKIIHLVLPHIDNLLDENYKKKKKTEIFKMHPSLKFKKNILYIPTWKKDERLLEEKINELAEATPFDEYNLILKPHPLSKLSNIDDRILMNDEFSSIDIALISDYFIADYSSIIFELLFLEKPIIFYAFDFKEVNKNRGFYIDYKKEIPNEIILKGEKVIESIEREDYDFKKARALLEEYVEIPKEGCVKSILDFIDFSLRSSDFHPN